MKLIERKEYLDKMVRVIGTPDIKVITGVRRSGKSKLLEAFKDYIMAQIPDVNVIHINFNLPDFEDLMEYRPLYDYVQEHYAAGRNNFVLIDEVSRMGLIWSRVQEMRAKASFTWSMLSLPQSVMASVRS